VKIKVDESKRAKQRGISDSDVWNIELSLTGFVDEVSLLGSSLKIDSSTPKHRRAAIPAMSLHLQS
jgi:hypothetical protein